MDKIKSLLFSIFPLMDPGSRLFFASIVGSFVFAGLFVVFAKGSVKSSFFKKNYWWNASTKVDYQVFIINSILKVFLISPLLVTSYYFSFQTVYFLNATFGGYASLKGNEFIFLLATVFAFVWDDFLRFFHHWLMHKVPFLWELHKTHHSAKVLTPITLYRIHPIESMMATVRNSMSYGVSAGLFMYLFSGQVDLVTLFGVNIFGFLCNFISGNLRHSHIPISFGFLEYIFISPKQHQIHHSNQVFHFDKNFGVWLSCWDQIFGSFLLSHKERIHSFGVEGVKAYSLSEQYFPKAFQAIGIKNMSIEKSCLVLKTISRGIFISLGVGMKLIKSNLIYVYFFVIALSAIYYEIVAYKTEMLLISQRTYYASQKSNCCQKTHARSYERLQNYLSQVQYSNGESY